MQLSKVIKEKRKELNMTQEQLAQQLAISTPAVSKWENDASMPDITLLPTLARLLKMDLNTLFSFHEKLSPLEINQLVEQLFQLVNQEGLDAAFTVCQAKIAEFPTDEELIAAAATTLEGFVVSHEETADESHFTLLSELFSKLEQSEDVTLQFIAKTAKIRNLIRANELTQAREVFASTQSVVLDASLIELQLLKAEGNQLAANQLIEQKILSAATDMYTYITTQFQTAIQEQQLEDISYYCHLLVTLVETYGLAPIFGMLPQLMKELIVENVEGSITVLTNIEQQSREAWSPAAAKLYQSLEGRAIVFQRLLLNSSLENLLQPASIEFLRTDERFQHINQQWDQAVKQEWQSLAEG